MIDIAAWTEGFLKALDETFGTRIWFVGIQGSYGRGEATQSSDMDMVVILDELSASDIQVYSDMLDKLPHRESVCGFLSGKQELLNWDKGDLFQFYHDTRPIKGSLDVLLQRIDGEAVDQAVKMGACNIYHACVHNMVFEKDMQVLRSLYKSASFLIQAIYFRRTGIYVTGIKELLQVTEEQEQVILRSLVRLKAEGSGEFDEMSRYLFDWVKQWI